MRSIRRIHTYAYAKSQKFVQPSEGFLKKTLKPSEGFIFFN